MTTSLIRQYYGWFNERRLSDAAGLFADDADVELIPGERAQGGSGYLRFAHAWVSAFPDATFAIQQIEHRTETLAEVYLLATGTHQGTLAFGVLSIQTGRREGDVARPRTARHPKRQDRIVGTDRRPQ